MAHSISPEQLLVLVQSAIREAPEFPYKADLGEPELKWLGRAAALLKAAQDLKLIMRFDAARVGLGTIAHSRTELLQPLYDLMSQLELRVPAELQGAFIAAGDAWNGYAALVRIMQREADDLLIVDPYVSGSVVTELVPHIVAKRSVRILTAVLRDICGTARVARAFSSEGQFGSGAVICTAFQCSLSCWPR